MSLLGVDIGSSSCKGVVFDVDGNELARETSSYAVVNMDSNKIEIDALHFRDAVFTVIRTLADKVKDDPIESFAISSHGETVIPVDQDGRPTANAIMNADNRAVEEVAWWEQSFGAEKIYRITGVPLHTMFSLNKIIWLRKNNPDIYNRTARFLSVGDFILTQLGLPPYTDYSLASRTMAFDINRLDWSEEILSHCEVPKDKLGIPIASGKLAGRLSGEMAKLLGLKEGTAVALGGHDQPCGALGAGAVDKGDVFDSAGTYECLVAVTDKAMNTPKALTYNLNSYCHVVPGKFVTLAFFPAGLITGWFVDHFCFEEKMLAEKAKTSVYTILEQKIAEQVPGPSGINITPHLVGSCTPSWDVRAKGVIAGITPATTKYHLYKAAFEGIACELALNVDALEEVMGQFEKMTIAGGNSRIPFTVQLRSDLTGKEIQVLKTDEAVCLGAAILAGIAIGKYRDASDAAKKVIKLDTVIEPNQKNRDNYSKQLKRYQVIYPSLREYREI